MGPRGGRVSPTTFSSWNVRSGCSQEQLERITFELGNDDIDFCAVQEVRLPDSGERDLESVHHKKGKTYKYKLLFSGLTPEEGRHHGVGLFIKESRKAFLETWEGSTPKSNPSICAILSQTMESHKCLSQYQDTRVQCMHHQHLKQKR